MKKLKVFFGLLIVVSIIGYYCFKQLQINNKDRKPPTINYSDNLITTVNASDEELLIGVSAYDEVDGDVSDSLIIENISKISNTHKVNITYAAYDRSNNVAKMTRIVEYQDYQLPYFKLNKPLIFTSLKDTNLLNAIEAFDVKGNDISNKIRIQYQQNPYEIEPTNITYPIIFTVSDELGGTKEITLNVDLIANNKDFNNVEVLLKDYLIYVKKGTKLNLSSYLDKIIYKDEEQKINNKNLEIINTVDTTKEGVYDIYFNYTLKDNLSGYSKLVVVVE